MNTNTQTAKILSIAELETIEAGIERASVDTLHQQLKDINASDRALYVNSETTLILSQKHLVVAEKVMNALDTKLSENIRGE